MKKKIKRIVIAPGCVSCGVCQAVCPEIFQISGTCQVKPGADVASYVDQIGQAAMMCPVSVIKIECDT